MGFSTLFRSDFCLENGEYYSNIGGRLINIANSLEDGDEIKKIYIHKTEGGFECNDLPRGLNLRADQCCNFTGDDEIAKKIRYEWIDSPKAPTALPEERGHPHNSKGVVMIVITPVDYAKEWQEAKKWDNWKYKKWMDNWVFIEEPSSDDKKKAIGELKKCLEEAKCLDVCLFIHRTACDVIGNWLKKEFPYKIGLKECFRHDGGKIHTTLMSKDENCIFDLLKSNLINSFLLALLPLHLSLQAFFGISRDEEGNWEELPNDLPEEIKGKFDRLFSEENREKAFLLVPEAEWDFYAEIGSRLGEPAPARKSEPYESQPLLNLVDKLFENKDEADKEIRKKIENLIQSEDLRTLCAILANIEDKGINEKLLNEGKLNSEEAELHKERIEGSREVLKKYDYCKKWLDKPPHTKWPRDIDKTENKPSDSYKERLVKQLREWNKDGEKAKNVIRSIEELADYLEKL